MRISDKAVVLQAVKYGDKKFILKLFSRTNGVISASCVTGHSPSSKIKSSAVLPLSLIDVQIIHKQNKEVQQLTEANCYYVTTNISNSLSKLSIAQFMNEVLIKCLSENSGNTALYDFIETCIIYLNESEQNFVNLHLHFLLEFTRYAGIEPNCNYSNENCYFDNREGNFTPISLAFPIGLDKDDSKLLSENLSNNLLLTKLTTDQRQRLLNSLVAYYQFHIPGFNQLRSLQVLNEILRS
jgi:DNA repair protein RecO (recombination protein O)